MQPGENESEARRSGRGRQPLISDAECLEIAQAFDGTTACIDALLEAWKACRPSVKRHTIIQAARRGGYKTAKQRKDWTPAEDQFVRDNWHKLSGDEVATALGRSFNSVNLRRKRLGIGRYEGDEFTIRDLEELTRLDHRQWHEFIERGWLRARARARRNGATPFNYVSLGALRSLLESHPEIYDYQTRARLEGPWVVGCFDEVHRLPAALAHRHAFARTQYRIGMSATADMRCDGRGALVSKMTGTLVGEDWTQQMDAGIVKRIPVKVILVEDVEHKHEVVGDLLKKHRSVVVLCEALEDGRELELRYGIPFVYSKTKDKLKVVRASRSMVLSRIGDAGISVPHCEVTVDHSGMFGSTTVRLKVEQDQLVSAVEWLGWRFIGLQGA